MNFQIKEFSEVYIPSAVELILQSYMREKEISDLLPDNILKDPKLIIDSLKSHAKNPSVAVLSNDTLVAYMLTGATFNFKNQKTALVPEYGHSSIDDDRKKLYRLMYLTLSSRWIQHKIHLHIIGHFAHDSELTDTLFQLGFGAILSEKLRDLSQVTHDRKFRIQYLHDPAKLVELAQEHRQYYPKAPIFVKKNPELEAILSDLKDHVEHGDRFLVHYAQDVPAGYLTIGALKKKGEGFLLRDTNTAQVKSAFIKPFFRGKGVGTALLDEAITWARKNGFDRLFVEHETANYYGGQFWEKHFSPYVYFSMRYIDNTI